MLRQVLPTSRSKRRQLLVVLACLGLTGYFGYHAVSGRHGLEARSRLQERGPTLKRELADLAGTRERLEREVALLTVEPPSPDLVEEIARELLGFVLPSEVVWVGR